MNHDAGGFVEEGPPWNGGMAGTMRGIEMNKNSNGSDSLLPTKNEGIKSAHAKHKTETTYCELPSRAVVTNMRDVYGVLWGRYNGLLGRPHQGAH